MRVGESAPRGTILLTHFHQNLHPSIFSHLFLHSRFPIPIFFHTRQGLNVQPGLIYIGPIGTNVQPQGVNIQPIKIAVAPVGKNIQPQGKLVAPAKLVYAPVKTLYNPQKGPVYAPIGDDLTTLDDNKPDNAGGDTGGGGL